MPRDHVALQADLLRVRMLAVTTLIGFLSVVFSEVIGQVGALRERLTAPLELASEH